MPFRLWPRCMTVHDHASVESISCIQEGLANPELIGFRLAIQPDAGPQAGMNKIIIPTFVAASQRTQEFVMVRGQRFHKSVTNVEGRSRGRLKQSLVDPIARQRLYAAKAPPIVPQIGFLNEIQHNLFMIALETDRLEARYAGGNVLDDATAIGSAVDIIADKKQKAVRRFATASFCVNGAHQLPQKLHVTMDIADRIDDNIVWNTRSPPRRRRSP